jgi:hypothetical protein
MNGEAPMRPPVVGQHARRHREDPCVPVLVEDVNADAGQRSVRRDESVVHAVHALDDRTGTGQVEARDRRACEHAGLRHRADQRPHRICGQRDVGVQVYARKRLARLVSEGDRVRLARHRRVNYAYRKGSGHVAGPVDARVGHHDDVEFVGRSGRQKVSQVCRNDGFLVMRRNDDTDDRSRAIAHARGFRHANLRPDSANIRIVVPFDRISSGIVTKRSKEGTSLFMTELVSAARQLRVTPCRTASIVGGGAS